MWKYDYAFKRQFVEAYQCGGDYKFLVWKSYISNKVVECLGNLLEMWHRNVKVSKKETNLFSKIKQNVKYYYLINDDLVLSLELNKWFSRENSDEELKIFFYFRENNKLEEHLIGYMQLGLKSLKKFNKYNF